MDSASRRQFIQQAAGTVAGGMLAQTVGHASVASVTGDEQRGAPAAASVQPLSKGKALRALLQKPGVHAVPEAYCVFTARLAEIAGFPAVYVGGSMMSGMHLGLEDWGLITNPEMVDIASRIARAVSIPVIVDGDQAGETPLNVYRNTRLYDRAGLSALHIEDTVNPKHMGGASNRLVPIEEWLARIAAAVDARSDPDFVIIARTDEENPDEAIKRGIAAVKTGADAFMPWGMQGPRINQIDRIATEVGVPLVIPHYPMSEASKTKGKLNVFAGYAYPAAMTLYDTQLKELQEHGDITRNPLPAAKEAEVTGAAEYRKIAARWATLRK